MIRLVKDGETRKSSEYTYLLRGHTWKGLVKVINDWTGVTVFFDNPDLMKTAEQVKTRLGLRRSGESEVCCKPKTEPFNPTFSDDLGQMNPGRHEINLEGELGNLVKKFIQEFRDQGLYVVEEVVPEFYSNREGKFKGSYLVR